MSGPKLNAPHAIATAKFNGVVKKQWQDAKIDYLAALEDAKDVKGSKVGEDDGPKNPQVGRRRGI